MTEPPKLTRFDKRCGPGWSMMDIDPEGHWVRHADAVAEVERLREALGWVTGLLLLLLKDGK